MHDFQPRNILLWISTFRFRQQLPPPPLICQNCSRGGAQKRALSSALQEAVLGARGALVGVCDHQARAVPLGWPRWTRFALCKRNCAMCRPNPTSHRSCLSYWLCPDMIIEKCLCVTRIDLCVMLGYRIQNERGHR